MKILVVCENEEITSAMRLTLSDKFQGDTFTSPAEALSRYRPGAYDLKLLDVVMPGEGQPHLEADIPDDTGQKAVPASLVSSR